MVGVIIGVLAAIMILALVGRLLMMQSSRKGKMDINLGSVTCPQCGELQPNVRRPRSMRRALWGGSTCSVCQ